MALDFLFNPGQIHFPQAGAQNLLRALENKGQAYKETGAAAMAAMDLLRREAAVFEQRERFELEQAQEAAKSEQKQAAQQEAQVIADKLLDAGMQKQMVSVAERTPLGPYLERSGGDLATAASLYAQEQNIGERESLAFLESLSRRSEFTIYDPTALATAFRVMVSGGWEEGAAREYIELATKGGFAGDRDLNDYLGQQYSRMKSALAEKPEGMTPRQALGAVGMANAAAGGGYQSQPVKVSELMGLALSLPEGEGDPLMSFSWDKSAGDATLHIWDVPGVTSEAQAAAEAAKVQQYLDGGGLNMAYLLNLVPDSASEFAALPKGEFDTFIAGAGQKSPRVRVHVEDYAKPNAAPDALRRPPPAQAPAPAQAGAAAPAGLPDLPPELTPLTPGGYLQSLEAIQSGSLPALTETDVQKLRQFALGSNASWWFGPQEPMLAPGQQQTPQNQTNPLLWQFPR